MFGFIFVGNKSMGLLKHCGMQDFPMMITTVRREEAPFIGANMICLPQE